MPRKKRPYQPGTAYHLTTRTQGRQALFTPVIRSEMLGMLADSLRTTDVTLLAHAIMPNHLHLVVQHRSDPLGRLMQRFLCRVARRVQKRHGIEGHVFERPYCHLACLSPEHLRNAIAYTNLNPVRAGLCEEDSDYPWSSARGYLARPSSDDPVYRFLHCPFWLFAQPECSTAEGEIGSYRAFLKWRLERDHLRATGICEDDLPPVLEFRNDIDERWSRDFLITAGTVTKAPTQTREDLRDIARRTLAEEGDPVSLLEIRTSRGPQELVELRWKMIRRMTAAGHPGFRIAEYFGISKAAVSYSLARSGSRTKST